MGEKQTAGTAAATHHRLLLRGESTIASIGIALAAILLCAIGASAWWTTRTHREEAREAEAQRIRTIASLLTNSAETMLNSDELSSLRRLVIDTARQQKLSACSIVLPDGQIIADSEPSKIARQEMPDTWSAGLNPPKASERTAESELKVTAPLTITGRGMAELQVSGPLEVASNQLWPVQAGLGVIGAVSLAAVLLVYRHSRARLRAVGAIREALLAIVAGEDASSALSISSDLGVEATAWNRILEQSDTLKQQKVAEKARESLGDRRRSKSDLDDAADVMPQGILLVDEKMRCKYANGAAAVFLQADRDKLTGTDVRQYISAESVRSMLDAWLTGKSRQRTTLEAERGDGATGAAGVLRWSMRPVRREDGGSAMIIIEDITQQRVAEEARHAFVAHATHELRTPLTNIRLYVETALDDGENDAALRAKCLNVINSESRRLERIVNDLLSTAEIEAGSFSLKKDDVHLKEIFTDLQADYEAQAKDKKIELVFNLPPKLPVIQADRDKIGLALHNLISNALKYTPAGGTVQVNVEADEHQMTVDVVDTGIGISEEDQSRLFEKFYRAHDKRIAEITGSGLGLALAREVVRLHGGDIVVHSKLDQGSTFTMNVPFGQEAA